MKLGASSGSASVLWTPCSELLAHSSPLCRWVFYCFRPWAQLNQEEWTEVKAQLICQDMLLGEDPGVPIPRAVLLVLLPLAWLRNFLGNHCLPIFSLEKNRFLLPRNTFSPFLFLVAWALMQSPPVSWH